MLLPTTYRTTILQIARCASTLALLACFSMSSASGTSLSVGLSVSRAGDLWQYAITNTEPQSSGNFVSGMWLLIDNAPFEVVASPSGWSYDTDSFSFVFWFSTDTGSPWVHDIGPGERLAGFYLRSPSGGARGAFDVSSWNHSLNEAGPVGSGSVLVPSAVEVPEPAGFMLFAPSVVFLVRRSSTRASDK